MDVRQTPSRTTEIDQQCAAPRRRRDSCGVPSVNQVRAANWPWTAWLRSLFHSARTMDLSSTVEGLASVILRVNADRSGLTASADDRRVKIKSQKNLTGEDGQHI